MTEANRNSEARSSKTDSSTHRKAVCEACREPYDADPYDGEAYFEYSGRWCPHCRHVFGEGMRRLFESMTDGVMRESSTLRRRAVELGILKPEAPGLKPCPVCQAGPLDPRHLFGWCWACWMAHRIVLSDPNPFSQQGGDTLRLSKRIREFVVSVGKDRASCVESDQQQASGDPQCDGAEGSTVVLRDGDMVVTREMLRDVSAIASRMRGVRAVGARLVLKVLGIKIPAGR